MVSILSPFPIVVGTDGERIRGAFREALKGRGKAGRVPEFWDGQAAERIAAAIADWAEGREAQA